MKREKEQSGNFLKNISSVIATTFTCLVMIGFIFGLTYNTARATDGGGSLGILQKELVSDIIAWQFGDAILYALAMQTLEWAGDAWKENINYKQSHVINPTAFIQGMDDQVTNVFIENLREFERNSAFGTVDGLADSLERAVREENDPSYTRLETTIPSETLDTFVKGDFIGGGGWNTWLELTSNPQNYFDGAVHTGLYEIESVTTDAIDWAVGETHSDGFVTLRRCGGFNTIPHAPVRAYQDPYDCEAYMQVTPGSIVAHRVNTVLNSDIARMAASDEITEILEESSLVKMTSILTGNNTLSDGQTSIIGGFSGLTSYYAGAGADPSQVEKSFFGDAEAETKRIFNNFLPETQERLEEDATENLIIPSETRVFEELNNITDVKIVPALKDIETAIDKLGGVISGIVDAIKNIVINVPAPQVNITIENPPDPPPSGP